MTGSNTVQQFLVGLASDYQVVYDEPEFCVDSDTLLASHYKIRIVTLCTNTNDVKRMGKSTTYAINFFWMSNSSIL